MALIAGNIGLAWMNASAGSARKSTPFEFRDGDRVALVGDTLIERESAYGFIEQRLTAQFPDRHVVFRNLGWSADTPAGESRASFDFDKPGKGFEKLKDQLTAVQPTVVIVGYGMADSFSGRAGLSSFRKNLNTLLDAAANVCTNHVKPRFILLAPISHENLGLPLPDPASHNRELLEYAKAVEAIAAERRCAFVNLERVDNRTPTQKTGAMTDNGIHLSERGYYEAGRVIAEGLGWDIGTRKIRIAAAEPRSMSPEGLDKNVRATKMRVEFEDSPKRLPLGPPVSISPKAECCELQISGLENGEYEVRIDGEDVLSATARELDRGVRISSGPEFEQAEALRAAILTKNELCFDRWRPQNETYLFGFRKYEQGQNAKEIPMFDPLIAAEEKKIDELKTPRRHRYEIVRMSGDLPSVANAKETPFRSVLRLDRRASGGPVFTEPETNGAAASGWERPNFEIADGLEVNLYAKSPLLAKPIQMNFDPEGRLWIASSSIYPQIEPGQVADDKIIVLEDVNHDGYAEKSTVFADGLFIPTTVIPGDGGAYVGQSTELLHFSDTDGDGKADQKRIVLTAFGTEDTHHMVHTLRWGPDGQLYFNQSIYIHSHIETPRGVERLNSGGVWQLRPSTMELGIFLRGFCNPWGHDFDAYGQSFLTDGAGFKGISYGLPGATYFTYAIMRREMDSISPGNYPKFCSLEILRSRQFPDDWQGNVITCDFRAHRVVRFGIEEKGAGYAAHEIADLIRSTNVSFRPIDVKLGPDGALYIADWSNPIIQHGEVDFRDARRDHEHGRIWRVTAKGRPLVPWPALRNASNAELFEQLLSPNSFNQEQARRVLTERGTDHARASEEPGARRVAARQATSIRKDLDKWTAKQRSDEALLQALWMYQSIDVANPTLLERVLRARDGRIRAAGTRVAAAWHNRIKNAGELLAAMTKDEHPRVRLEAIRGLAKIPSLKSADLVLGQLDKPIDPFLDYGIWLSINDLAKPWLAGVQSGAWKTEGREKQLEFGLKAVEPALAAPALAHVLQTRSIPRDGSGPWIELIQIAGDDVLLKRLFEQVLNGGFDPAATIKALRALDAAAKDRDAKPSGDLVRIGRISTNSTPEVRELVLRLAGHWKLKQFIPELIKIAESDKEKHPLRMAAFDSLRSVAGERVKSEMKTVSEMERDDWGRRHAIQTWAALDLNAASGPAVSLLEKMNEKDAEEFWKAMLTIKDSGPAFAKALPKTGLPVPMAKAGLRVARSAGKNEPDLVWALTRGANLEDDAQALSPAELRDLAKKALANGDPARGEMVFRRKDVSCTSCHSIGGVGGKVGPDLTSIGASAPMDYLIESVLYPNRKIKEGFHTVVVETKDGEEFSGVLASENSDKLVLRDSSGKDKEISKKDVQNRATGGSIMPSGLVDGLTPSERLDLYRFLSELGKPGPFDAAKSHVARAWKLLPQTLDLAQFGDDKVLGTKLTDSKWQAIAALVDGRLRKQDLSNPLDQVKDRDPQAIYAATQFEAAKAGPIDLKIEGPANAELWVDGKLAGTGQEMRPTIQSGKHVAILKVDSKNLPDSLRLRSDDVTFLAE